MKEGHCCLIRREEHSNSSNIKKKDGEKEARRSSLQNSNQKLDERKHSYRKRGVETTKNERYTNNTKYESNVEKMMG